MTDKLSVADDWIEWNGGLRAPDDWDGGKVKFRDGSIGYTGAGVSSETSCCWENDDMPEDIIAYRLARERGL